MPREAFKTLIDVVKPVNIERYIMAKIYLNSRGQSCYAYIVGVRSIATYLVRYYIESYCIGERKGVYNASIKTM